MEFSVIFEAQLADPTVEREHQLIRDCVEQAVLAERMGFDRIWAVEHHSLKWYAHMSAPEIFLTWVAARTNTIRIGHGVVCMPFNFNHPVRVAERAAMLDLLSGGRLDLGAGRGGTEQETSLCGVDRDRTTAEVEEALRIIGRAWQEEELEYHGRLIDIDPHPILPRPRQTPHPPLFLACSRGETLVRAAELGIGALVMGFAGPESIAGMRSVYDAAIAGRDGSRFVSTVVNDHFSVLCPTIVLDDREEARRIGTRGSGSSPSPSATGTAGPVFRTRPWSREPTRPRRCAVPRSRWWPGCTSWTSPSGRTRRPPSTPTTPTAPPTTRSRTWSG